MSTTTLGARRPVGVVAGCTAAFGALVLAYGLLLLSLSPLGGLWIAAVGLALVLSGAFASPWAVARLGLPTARARRLSLAFASVAVLLAVAFVLVNGMTVEAGAATS